MLIWPFKAGSELIESLEWRTDVMRARSAEQRVALRQAPRITHQISHVLDHAQYASARQIMRGPQGFSLPDWTESVHVGNVAAGMSVFVPFDTAGTPFVVGGEAVLWESPSRSELVEVETVSAGGIELVEVVTGMAGARLLPALPAIAPGGLSAQRPAGRYISASVAMQITESADLSASGYAQYRGHDVLPVCPVVADGAFDESVIWPTEIVDNDIGQPAVFRDRTIPDEKFMMRWHEFTRHGQRDLRAWLHSRKGRQKAFWASTWARDFELAVAIGSADPSVIVFAPPGLPMLPRKQFDIEIVTASGVKLHRQVTDVTAASAVGGRATLALAISITTGQAVSDPQRISYFRCARFDADRFELLHRAGAGMAVAAACVEVPVP